MKSELIEYLPMLPEYYADAFRLLFAYENKMRIFVYAVLRGSIGEAWKSITPNQGPSLKSRVETRQFQLRQYGHIGSLSETPMDFLTMDELVGIITDDATKKYFTPHFPGSIEKVFAPKLREILITRNHLMHFRQIQQQDADRLYASVVDPIRIFDKTIEEFTHLYWPEDMVETDSETPKPTIGEDWLPVLMKAKATRIEVVETPSRKWVKIFLFFPYVLRKNDDDGGVTYIESYRVIYSNIIGLLKDALLKAVYYNKFDYRCEDVEGDDTSVFGERLRGVEICFLKSIFRQEEAIIRGSIMQMLEDVEEGYVELVKKQGVGDMQRVGSYFRKQADFEPLYLSNLKSEIHRELTEEVSPEDWTAILMGPAFESIYRRDEK